MLRATLLALSLAFSAPQVSADTFDDALSAHERGDFDMAAKAFRKLAEQGDVVAQYNLGFMYEYGTGVLQNYIMAHMWLNLASANGAEKVVGELRDELAAKMTAADISKAQALARECLKSGYKSCGD